MCTVLGLKCFDVCDRQLDERVDWLRHRNVVPELTDIRNLGLADLQLEADFLQSTIAILHFYFFSKLS